MGGGRAGVSPQVVKPPDPAARGAPLPPQPQEPGERARGQACPGLRHLQELQPQDVRDYGGEGEEAAAADAYRPHHEHAAHHHHGNGHHRDVTAASSGGVVCEAVLCVYVRHGR